MEKQFESSQDRLDPIKREEWKDMKVGEIVCAKGYPGLYRIEKINPGEKIALLQEVDEHGEPVEESFIAPLRLLSKEFA